MKHFKNIVLLLAFLCPALAHAIGTSTFPINNQTTTYVIDASTSPYTTTVNLPNNANNARVQLPTRDVNSCTIMALDTNVGKVFMGGNTVTNSNGLNEGWPMTAGQVYGPVTMTNPNLYYFATATNNNKVKIFCN